MVCHTVMAWKLVLDGQPTKQLANAKRWGKFVLLYLEIGPLLHISSLIYQLSLHIYTFRYYPSVFVLKPGQVVHINKGRLHAFRKLAPAVLQDTDCHYELRNDVLETKESMTEDLCFSIAWDWMFKGVTSEGINREVSSILECSRLNREHDLASLAIPETTLLFLAKENIAKYQLEVKASNPVGKSLFAMNIPSHQPASKSEPDAKTVLQGILPSIQYVVNRHNSSVKFSREWEKKTKHVRDSWRVSIDSKPNTWQDPGTFTLDPYVSYCNVRLKVCIRCV